MVFEDARKQSISLQYHKYGMESFVLLYHTVRSVDNTHVDNIHSRSNITIYFDYIFLHDVWSRV